MKFTVTTPKPRNPFVAAARRRIAGAHRPSNGARRQHDRQALRLEMDRMKPSP